jgi:SEC-C motif
MPGRNEPCPCGSGRKYKHCCLNTQEQRDFVWRQLRAAEGRFVPELLKLSLDECGPELLGRALDEFFLWDGVPEDYEHTEEFDSFFVPWFAYAFVADPDDPDRLANAPRESLASLYLRRHSQRLSKIEHAFLEAAATSPLSFYVVTSRVPGQEIGLRDVLTGAEVVVREQSASGMVRPGTLLFTRVLTVEGLSIMSGCAPLVIPPSWHLPILDFRERFARGKGRLLTRDRLLDMEVELRELYFYIDDQVRNPPLPELRNTDGDRLVLTTLTYRLQCGPSAAFDRLQSLARASRDDAMQLLSEAELDETGNLRSVTFPWNKKGNRLHREWDNTTLGTLTIDGDRLEVQVNATRRASRVQREIAKRLGADAVLESRTADPVENLLAERRRSPRDRIAELEDERLQQQPEVQEFLRQQNERHWESWIDTRLPALGNRTPRQAARTAEGRERLEALLADFAWMGERGSNPMAPDIPALRTKLGFHQ